MVYIIMLAGVLLLTKIIIKIMNKMPDVLIYDNQTFTSEKDDTYNIYYQFKDQVDLYLLKKPISFHDINTGQIYSPKMSRFHPVSDSSSGINMLAIVAVAKLPAGEFIFRAETSAPYIIGRKSDYSFMIPLGIVCGGFMIVVGGLLSGIF